MYFHFFTLLFFASVLWYGCEARQTPVFSYTEHFSYPHLLNNPYLDDKMRQKIIPHLLPKNHKAMAILEQLFSQSRVTENLETMQAAGFELISNTTGSFVTVVRHPLLPGYVIKCYLDSEKRIKRGKPGWEWLVRRCIGAQYIRDLIREKKIKKFTVPDKWIYILPSKPLPTQSSAQPILVLETDMQLTSREETIRAWKTQITPVHLRELLLIFKHKYGSTHVDINVPFTKKGTFAFTDTENPKKEHDLRKVTHYLSKRMQKHWKRLIKKSKF